MNVKSLTSFYDSLMPNYVTALVEQQRRIQEHLTASLRPFETELLKIQEQFSFVTAIARQYQDLRESSERWAEALTIVQSELPKRGWYLTGQEPGRLTPRVATLINEQKWEEIDKILVAQATSLNINAEKFTTWLHEHSVPKCCIRRARIFLDARAEENHEVATLVGVPLIDELSRALYCGRDFTTKRGRKQLRPQIACTTTTGESPLNHFCKGFVDTFGLLHQDFEPAKAEDENYFNRHAIVHGLMRRNYGPKDSAKTFMALMFVTFAFENANHEDN